MRTDTLPPRRRAASFVLVAAIVCCVGGISSANPIVMDDRVRPITMIAEEVRVLVGAGESKVTGVYRFRLGEPYAGMRADAHVNVHVPVLMPVSGTQSSGVAASKPVVRLGKRELPEVEREKPLPFGHLNFVDMPRSWRMEFHLFQIPTRSMGKEFEIEVAYTQPHFAGDVSGYVPMNPPRQSGASRVVFVAESGRKLKHPGGLGWFSKTHDSLLFVPVDRKLIRVRSVPGRS